MQLTVRELPSPTFSHPLKGQENMSPVLVVIDIHSTPHPGTNSFENIFSMISPSIPFGSLLVNLAVIGKSTKLPWREDGIKGQHRIYRHCTAAKDCFVGVFVNLAKVSEILPRVPEASPIWRSLAAVSQTVADFHHSTTITRIILAVACLDRNCRHMLT